MILPSGIGRALLAFPAAPWPLVWDCETITCTTSRSHPVDLAGSLVATYTGGENIDTKTRHTLGNSGSLTRDQLASSLDISIVTSNSPESEALQVFD